MRRQQSEGTEAGTEAGARAPPRTRDTSTGPERAPMAVCGRPLWKTALLFSRYRLRVDLVVQRTRMLCATRYGYVSTCVFV